MPSGPKKSESPAEVEDALQDGLVLHADVDGVRAEVLGKEEALVAVLSLVEAVSGALELVGQHRVPRHGSNVLTDGADLNRYSVVCYDLRVQTWRRRKDYLIGSLSILLS